LNAALITVVYQQDLYMFYLHALSLDKNWQGPRNWHIIIEDFDTTIPYVEEIVSRLSNTWTITIDRPELGPDHFKPAHGDGWWRQQTLKLWAATHFLEDLFIVLDAKNILLKPVDLSYFYHYGSCAVTIRESGTQDDMEPYWLSCKTKLQLEGYDIHRCSDLTPWVWPKYIVQSTLDRVHDLSLDTETRWQHKHRLLEFQLVWQHSWDKYEWHDWGEMVYFQVGPSSYQSDQQFHEHLVEGQKRFREHEKMVFWTQHRRDMHRNVMVKTLLAQVSEYGLDYDSTEFYRYFELGQAQQK
jgi:hypothetical protein